MSGRVRLPADPLPLGGAEEDIALGRVILDALKDALLAYGLLGLYPAVAVLGRDDLEAAATAQVVTVIEGWLEPPGETRRPAREQEVPEGERLLLDVSRHALDGGIEAVRGAVIALDDQALRAVVRDPIEVAWLGVLADREERRGGR